ncbi:MAG: CotH kinase family protein [Bacteroidales bacterium]|nr:CotH kinase family protein [Bacteroidales bacterium]
MQKLSLFISFIISFACFTLHAQSGEKISKKEQLTNLPTFYITTPQAIYSESYYVNGTLYVAGPDTLAGKYNDSIGIRVRGNSTANLEKKPYRMKLYEKTKLLGMPAKDKNWPMLANHMDKSLMRNALAFKISKILGIYFTPASRFVDVVVNNEFVGNYLVTDQVEVSGDRVDISKQAAADTTIPAIEGGYLVEIDGFGNSYSVSPGALFPEAFSSTIGTVSIKYPKDDEINLAQRRYIVNYFNQFGTVMNSYRKGDPLDSIRKYLDIDAMINWYLTSELCGNSDTFWSIYIMKERGKSQFTFGPIWDNDIAFDNDQRIPMATTSLMLDVAHPFGSMQSILRNLFSNPEINKKLLDRWSEIYHSNFKEQLLASIDSMEVLLNASQTLNYSKWPIYQSYNSEMPPIGSYKAEVAYLRSYVSERIEVLDMLINTDLMELGAEFKLKEDQWYSLTNVKALKVLDLKDSLPDDFTQTVLWTDREGNKESQLFRFTKVNDSSYILTNKLSGKVLEGYVKVDDGGIPSKMPSRYKLCINTYQEGKPTQLWKLKELKYGVFNIINQYSGLALNNGSTLSPDGAIVNISTLLTTGSQQWRFTSYPDTETPIEKVPTAKASVFASVGFLHIECNGHAKLRITNLVGQVVLEHIVTSTLYDVSLPRGIYGIQIDGESFKIAVP